ncbi:MAG: hypothetical protein ACK5E6_07205 [Cyanobacteriota bacterium]
MSISSVSAPSVGTFCRAAWAEPAISGSRPAPKASSSTAMRRSSGTSGPLNH